MKYYKSKKNVALSILILMLVISISLSIIFYIWGLIIPAVHHLIISIFSTYNFIIIWNYKKNFDFVYLIKISLYPYIITFFVSNIIFWEVFPLNIIWGAAFPLASLFLHNIKKTINISIYTIVSIVSAPFIANILGISDKMNFVFKILSKEQLFILNYLHITFFIIVITVIVYQFQLHNEVYAEDKFSRNKNIDSATDQLVISDEIESDSQQSVHDIKLNRIYQNMIDYLEVEKPYTNPDFRLEDLAKNVGTNRSYASAALNKKGKTFNNFINWYRVEHAKKELQDNKKNMREIYTESGFRYHSTFLKIFEESVGVKPSKYQYMQKNA